MSNQNGVTTDEVKNRPEDLLEESVATPVPMSEKSDPGDSPLTELKAVVLSVDWEISDEIMTRLIEEAGKLEEKYKDDKTLVLFPKLLGSIGKYIKNKKAGSHPDAIKLLHSVYESLEKVVLPKGIKEEEKKKILFDEVKRFRELKDKIARNKVAKPPEKIKPEIEDPERVVGLREEPGPQDMSPISPHEAFAYALEEIKQVIKAEFQALRAELKLWREGE